MKRFVSLFLCFIVVAFSAITVFGAEEEETIPIPERPEEFYIIDQPGVLTKRACNNIIRKGNRLFATTGAQVVVIVVDENNDVELGLLAQQMLERWEIGAYDRDNGFVMAIDFQRGRASYAVGDGLSEVLTTSVVTKLITDYELGDGYAEGNYVMVVSSLYNDIESLIYSYYSGSLSEWDGKTYNFKAGYEVEEVDNTLMYAAVGAGVVVLLFVIVIIIAICHNKKKDKMSALEEEDECSEEEAVLATETEDMGDVAEKPEEIDGAAEEYITDEGEYNTEEGEYNTDSDAESYNGSED